MNSQAKPHLIRRIVIGVDGSEASAAALAWAIAMAQGMNSEIVAVFGLEIPVDLSLGFAPISAAVNDPRWRDTLRQALEDDWTAALKQSGVPYRVEMREGRPATVIVEIADEVDADIVVVGRRGRGGVAELLLGSVSHEVGVHCRRPVLMIS